MFHIFSKQFNRMCIHLNFPCPNLISLHPRETALVLLIYRNWLFLFIPKIAKTFWWKSDISTSTYHMTKIRDEGSKTIFLWKYFYTAQAHTGLFKISLCLKNISGFVSYLTSNGRFHQVPFFYYVFYSTTIYPVEFHCLPYFSVDLFCFISIFSLIYMSPSVLWTEVLFSRNLMLLCDSQMSPNVLKAILNYKDFLYTFSTLVTYMQTLQPLLIYLAVTMTLILPFLFQ